MSRSLKVVAAIITVLTPHVAAAQTSAPPVHKHYETPADAAAPAPGQPLAPRLQNLGSHTFPVSTKNSRAQLFINQGVNLAFGFNHAEAARAFAEAARLDPGLAIAYAGHALVLGPNINAPMDPEKEAEAMSLAQKAVSLKAKATPRERAYIDAIAARYTGKAEDRDKGNRAFADAMRRLRHRVPGGRRRAHDLRRGLDGPAAVELLDA